VVGEARGVASCQEEDKRKRRVGRGRVREEEEERRRGENGEGEEEDCGGKMSAPPYHRRTTILVRRW
jgi:hypothetical protein